MKIKTDKDIETVALGTLAAGDVFQTLHGHYYMVTCDIQNIDGDVLNAVAWLRNPG